MNFWLMLLSDAFSVITIALCLILKVPQIIRIVKSGQATGLSFNGLLLELSSYTITMMYNYCNKHALLSYMEYPIIIIQEYILIGLVTHYKKMKRTAFPLLLLIYLTVSLLFAYGILPKFLLTLMLPLTTPVGATSKIMQLVEIIRRKNANSVSVLTWFLSFFTNVTRVYTIYLDSADFYLLLNFTISSALSGAVMAAAMYYQKQAAQQQRIAAGIKTH
ncbi:hypothetical protein RUM44_010270 [Polyplax serrata]|uniref:Solute carrier family 66 member 3 n=1 Tax=Polyplax serrata TaxID=468196 RepID=A0ABR1AV27_POLSC